MQNYIKNMKTFGEMAVVAIHEGKKMQPNWTIEEKHVCLLDMQRTMLGMYSVS